MTPTRELALQITKECKKFSKPLGLRVVCVYGGTGISEQVNTTDSRRHSSREPLSSLTTLVNKKKRHKLPTEQYFWVHPWHDNSVFDGFGQTWVLKWPKKCCLWSSGVLELIVHLSCPDCWAEERSRDHRVHTGENDRHAGGQQWWVHAPLTPRPLPPTRSLILIGCHTYAWLIDKYIMNQVQFHLLNCRHYLTTFGLSRICKTVVCFLKIRASAGRWTWCLRGSSDLKPESSKMMCIVTLLY